MRRLSEKNGWFVPVCALLDYLRGKNTLERKWLWHKIRIGTT